MTTPLGPAPTVAPAVRVPAQDDTLQQTITQLQTLTALLGSPAQQGTLANLLQQLAQAGAQPFVPNMQSASVLEQPPGIWTLAKPPAAYRIWGGYVAFTITASSGYSGTDRVYSKVYVNGAAANSGGAGTSAPFVVSHVELGVAGASQAASDSLGMGVPGVPFAANTPLILDVNGNQAINATVMRASGNIFYSIPLWLQDYLS